MNEIELYAQDIGETTEVSWHGPENMSFEQWSAIGRTMQVVGRSLGWWLGDWLNYGEQHYGETYAQAVEYTDNSIETLKKYKAVAERILPEWRQASLSWTHHFAVAYLPEEQRGEMLEIAARFELSTRDLKTLVGLNHELRARVLERAQGMEVDNARHLMGLITDMRLTKAGENGARPESDEEEDTCTDDEGAIPFGAPRENFVASDTIHRFWQAAGFPVRKVEADHAAWAGIVVRAEIDELGNPILVWEVGNA